MKNIKAFKKLLSLLLVFQLSSCIFVLNAHADTILNKGVYHENYSGLSKKGNWIKDSNPSHDTYGMIFSEKANESIEFTFYGTGFEWYAYCSPWAGKAKVYIDGVYASTVDQYLFAVYYNRLVYYNNNLSLGTHTVKIVTTGEKNPNSANNHVSLDRIIINNNTTEDSTYKVYQKNYPVDIYVGQYETKAAAEHAAGLYNNTYVTAPKTHAKFTVYQITQSGQTHAVIGEYDNLEAALARANNFYNTYVIDKDGQKVFSNGFYVYQQTTSAMVTVGSYDTTESAIAKASQYKDAFVKNPEGTLIWRGRYEVYQGKTLLGRFNTFTEALVKADAYDGTKIIDVTNFDTVVWNKKKNGYVTL